MLALSEMELIGLYALENEGNLGDATAYDVLTWAHAALAKSEADKFKELGGTAGKPPDAEALIKSWIAEKNELTLASQAGMEFAYRRLKPYIR